MIVIVNYHLSTAFVTAPTVSVYIWKHCLALDKTDEQDRGSLLQCIHMVQFIFCIHF